MFIYSNSADSKFVPAATEVTVNRGGVTFYPICKVKFDAAKTLFVSGKFSENQRLLCLTTPPFAVL
ncbi:MAG: hypothetical protein IJU91_10300 [Selenomonadaceae bacterium]|nr:hypothetical protein [Selenomonadaceae bacterium]